MMSAKTEAKRKEEEEIIVSKAGKQHQAANEELQKPFKNLAKNNEERKGYTTWPEKRVNAARFSDVEDEGLISGPGSVQNRPVRATKKKWLCLNLTRHATFASQREGKKFKLKNKSLNIQ